MRRPRGISLVEVVISAGIVGVMLVAALATVGASQAGQFALSRGRQGHLLARALMAEILRQDYQDASGPVFGPEADEITGTREKFDDVDDYHNWSESPPKNPDGTEIPGATGMSRTVVVQYVSPSNLQQTVGSDQGVKRITVKTLLNGKELATLLAVRTRGRETLSN